MARGRGGAHGAAQRRRAGTGVARQFGGTRAHLARGRQEGCGHFGIAAVRHRAMPRSAAIAAEHRHLRALARGLGELPLIPGTVIGTLAELAQPTREADKDITF